MELELGKSEKALGEMGDESKETAKDTEKLAREEDKAGKSTQTLGDRVRALGDRLQQTGAKVRAFAANIAKLAIKAVAGLAAGVAAAAVGIGIFVLKTAQAADEIVESAEKIGISTTKYQEFQFIAEQVGTDVETVGRAFARTTKAIAGADEEGSAMAKTLAELGVATRDVDGDLRSADDVFADIITALGRMENETQRDIVAQQIFGKSFQELVPLINLGADGLQEMTDRAHELGAVMSEDTVQGLADFNDQVAAIKGGVKGLLGQLAGAFLPLIKTVADRLQTWLSSAAVKAGIEKFKGFIQGIADAINTLLSGDIAGFVEKISGLGEKIARALGASPEQAAAIGAGVRDFAAWVQETIPKVAEFFNQLKESIGKFIVEQVIPFVQAHGAELKGALIAIGIALGVIAVVVPIVTGLIAALTSPITLIIAAVALLGAAWAGNWGGIQEKTRAVIDFIKPYITQAIQFLQEFIGNFLEAVRAWWAEHGEQVIAIVQAWWEGIQNTVRFWIDLISSIIRTVLGAIKAFWDEHGAAIMDAARNAWDFIKSIVDTALANIETIFAAFRLAFQGDWEGFGEKIREAWDRGWDKIKEILSAAWDFIKKAVADGIAAIIKWFDDTDWKQVGIDILMGIAGGISAGTQWVVNAIIAVAKAIWGALVGFFKSDSPSKRMIDFGKNSLAAGMAQGVIQGIPQLSRAINLALGGLSIAAAGPDSRLAQITNNNNRQAVNIFGGLNLTGVNNSRSLLAELAGLMP